MRSNTMTAQTDTAGTVTTVYKVSGMTCGHCEGAVSSEISEISNTFVIGQRSTGFR
jgi:hypothetical protein